MPEIDFHNSLDPELRQAARAAQGTFKHFWYQVSTDFNRIVPALGLACVKAPFSDDFSDPQSPAEHMWIDQIFFDGETIQGVLINQPNQVTSVSEGDEISLTLPKIEDWLCEFDDNAYGGYSIQVIRSRMTPEERTSHDEAWGLNFPEIGSVRLPERSEEFERNVLQSLNEQIESDNSILHQDFGEGRTILHLMSLYGRPESVTAVVQAGADPNQRCGRGWTALEYARAVGWDEIVRYLETVTK